MGDVSPAIKASSFGIEQPEPKAGEIDTLLPKISGAKPLGEGEWSLVWGF